MKFVEYYYYYYYSFIILLVIEFFEYTYVYIMTYGKKYILFDYYK